MRLLRFTLTAVLLLAVVVLGALGLGPVPPLGGLLDPWHGVWAAARTAELPRQARTSIPGLRDSVHVVYDDHAVPHIFASSEEDAYRALGYVVARDRLFQLEMQTRATAGTLTELVGRGALDLDRGQRRLGLAAAAEQEWAALDSASALARAMRAYAAGVNAWIDGLSDADRPLEYHLLNARPMRWKPQYTLYLMKRMGYTLAFNNEDRTHQRLAALVGDAAADALLPVHSPIQQPIQPGPGRYPRDDFRRLPPPVSPHVAAGAMERDSAGGVAPVQSPSVARASGPCGSSLFTIEEEEGCGASPDVGGSGGDAVGSNNWAVSPRRTATHHALLAGDPHLDLTLPSIWYEAHLSVHPFSTTVATLRRIPPSGGGQASGTQTGAGGGGSLDVYGVTIPGTPGIVIGFNRDVAWSFTNTGNDVLDLYNEKLNDPAHPTRYMVDGTWRPVGQRVERYVGKHGELLAVDTVYYTHRGPLVVGDRMRSMRWLELEAGVGDALFEAQRAKSAVEWLRLMTSFRTPAQNGIVADRGGAIAIRSTGGFPIRPGDGRGDEIRDGSTSKSDWIGFWPQPRYPFARDPAQGYLVSANQEPKDPHVDPGYLGSDWTAPWRAIRINQLLAADSSVTVDALRRIQTDPGSARADAFLPLILAMGRRSLPNLSGAKQAAVKMALDLLSEWDGRYTRDNTRAVLFELAMDELQNRLWDELLSPMLRDRRVATPGEAVLLEALEDSTSVWWDDHRTRNVVEHADDIVAASLATALEQAEHLYGAPSDSSAWRWDRVHHANIYHLLGLRSLSALNLSVAGGPSTISPSAGSGRHGASWRMVVELGPQVQGWGVYPGGQSGNPASAHYEDGIAKWLKGQLDTLRFPRVERDLDTAHTMARLTLVPPGGGR